jgi:AcrR family transcriptional regulator
MGLREEKKLRQRDAIVETASALFRERGYDAVRVSDIAARLAISDKTFFNYFPSKDDVLGAYVARLVDEYAALLPAPGAEVDPERALRRATGVLARAVEADRDFMRLVWTRSRFFVAEGDVKERWLAAYVRLEALFASARARGAMRREREPRQSAEVFFGIVHLTVVNWLVDWWGPESGALAPRLDRAVRAFWQGCAPSGANGSARGKSKRRRS